LFDGGPLTAANAQATYEARVDEILEALIAESARWGDNREKDSGTTFTQSDFIADKNALIASFFPTRSDLFAGDDLGPGLDNWNENGSFFENRNWLVALEAPEFNLSGNMLTLTDPQSSGGTIWYTLDGSDPRNRDTNNQSGTAIQYTGPITLTGSTQVWARIDDGNSGTVDDWSALAADTFFVESSDPAALRIVELMYNPNSLDGDTEYIELLNTGTTTIDLIGVRLADFSSNGYTFTGGTLAAGERIVVVGDQTDFGIRYPSVTNIAPGVFDGNLSNGGEFVSLYAPGDVLLQEFEYTDDPPWPTSPDGTGNSLVYVGPLDAGEDPNDVSPDDPFDVGANWAASSADGGSPGAAEPSESFPPGDYDHSGTVDNLDYDKWIADFGMTVTPFTESDGNGDGRVSAADYTVWRDHYGLTNLGSGSGAAVASVLQNSPTPVVDAPNDEIVEDSQPGSLAFSVSVEPGTMLAKPHHRLRKEFNHSESTHQRKQELLLRVEHFRDHIEKVFESKLSWLRQHHEDKIDEMSSEQETDLCSRIWENKDWLGGRFFG
jgi:hypothetical protein